MQCRFMTMNVKIQQITKFFNYFSPDFTFFSGLTAGMVYLGTPQPEYLDWSKELDLFGSDHHTEYPLLPREKLHFPEAGCFL